MITHHKKMCKKPEIQAEILLAVSIQTSAEKCFKSLHFNAKKFHRESKHVEKAVRLPELLQHSRTSNLNINMRNFNSIQYKGSSLSNDDS